MADLKILVDYDNVSSTHKGGGPVALAKILAGKLSAELLKKHSSVTVRMYGGWRTGGTLSPRASDLKAKIARDSPATIQIEQDGVRSAKRLKVELAEMGIGASVQLQETYVKNRELRDFRAKPYGSGRCTSPNACGFKGFEKINHLTQCNMGGCPATLSEVMVRDEQKMVDTLIVADMAHEAFVGKATELVLVSSDVDMWPGILLALTSGCAIIHWHTTPGSSTQQHLISTLVRGLDRMYKQGSL